jgi:FkbM family methyltransferase
VRRSKIVGPLKIVGPQRQVIEIKSSPQVLKFFRALPRFRGKWRFARALLGASAKKNPILIRDKYGNQMVVPNLTDTVGFALGVDGVYEDDAIEVLRTRLDRNSVFVDVGANIGAFSLALASTAKQVLAIEASPPILPFLRRNVEISRRTNISVVGCAVSAYGIDSVPFYVAPMDRFGMGSSAAHFDVQPLSVPACTLDSLVRDLDGGRIGAIKIDVEGFEAHVLLGAQELLDSPSAPLIVFEFGDWAEGKAFPGKVGWAQEILMARGYKLWTLPDYIRRAAPLKRPMLTDTHALVASRD